jgi:hypothetical protein
MYHTVQYSTISTIQYNKYNTVQYSTIQYNTVQYSLPEDEHMIFETCRRQEELKKAVGRPRLQYSKQVARTTAADSYTAMNRMACNSSRWKAANRSEDWGTRRR